MDILLTINKNQIHNTCILISSLRKHTDINETLNFYIIHDSLNDNDLVTLRNSAENVIINSITEDMNDVVSNKPGLYSADYNLYARAFAYKVLPSSLNRILYLDYDTLIINNISSFYNMEFKDKAIIGCEFPIKPEVAVQKKYLSLNSSNHYINTGVMLMNLSFMRAFNFGETMIAFIDSFDNINRPNEQSVINLFYKDFIKNLNYVVYNLGQSSLDFFNIKGAFIDQYISLDAIRNNTCILHFHDEVKPWMKSCTYSLKTFYNDAENYYIAKNTQPVS